MTLVKSEYAPPYSSLLDTIRSPLAASVVKTACMPAIPDENENAASVPSRFAINDSNAPSVGLP